MADTNEGRIPLLSVEAARAAAEEAGINPAMAELNVFRALLHQPKAAAAISNMLITLLFTGKRLDKRLRELIIMRIGWATGCDYEWTQHWRVATDLGIPEEALLGVRDWRNADCFTDADQAVLAATDNTLEQGSVSAETWAKLEEHVGGPDLIVETLAAIGCWNVISQIAKSIQFPLEEGVASWPPDGKSPEGAV